MCDPTNTLSGWVEGNFGCKCDTDHVDGFVQECSNSIANALELLQSCIKPLMYDQTSSLSGTQLTVSIYKWLFQET